MQPAPVIGRKLFVFIAVSLVETVYLSGFFLEGLVGVVKRVVFRVYFTLEYTVAGFHGTAGRKLGTVAHDHFNFFIIRMYSFFHLTFYYQELLQNCSFADFSKAPIS